MRQVRILNMIVLLIAGMTPGCRSSGSTGRLDVGGKHNGGYVGFTDENNPTTRAGRGEPSLDDQFRLAAWVYIDGQAGEFTEEDGRPLLQWFITKPVSTSPTFRVEVYTPLIGVPGDFSCVLRSSKTDDGSDVVYAIAAKEGRFHPGREYSITHPGDDFVIRNGMTRDIVVEIPSLPSGQYAFAASIKNSEKNVAALAVTYFTVTD